MWWKKNKNDQTAALPVLRAMRIDEVRDVAGFPLGLIFNPAKSEANMAVKVDEPMSVTVESVADWEASLVGTESLVATCASTTVRPGGSESVLWATFQSLSPAERKDASEFMTRLALHAGTIYQQADAAGMECIPMTKNQISQWAQTALSPDQEAEWPSVVREYEETKSSMTIDGIHHVCFEVVCTDPDLLDEAIATATAVGHDVPEGSVRIGQWFRPAELLGDVAPGRRAAIIDITHPSAETCERMVAVWISLMTPRTRLRVRRMWHRQQVATAAAAGLGILGWQRLEVAA